jgi:hypothetical protein
MTNYFFVGGSKNIQMATNFFQTMIKMFWVFKKKINHYMKGGD